MINLAAMKTVKNPLLVTGSVAYDTVETPNGISKRQVGGSASYASIAASYFCKPSLIGIIGEDFTEKQIFETHQIDLSGLQSQSGKTFFWHGKYKNDFKERDTITTELNVFEHFLPSLLPSHQKIEAILLANIHPALQLHTINQIVNPKFIATDTMNLWIETARDNLEKLTKKIHLLIINDEEAEQWTNETNLRKAANILLEKGPEFVIIKLGPDGALLFDNHQERKISAFPVNEVVDPTGTGDTFAGGMMGFLAATSQFDFESIYTAMKYGSSLASFCVEQFGLKKLVGLDANSIHRRVNRIF